MIGTGEWEGRRRRQAVSMLRDMLAEGLMERLKATPGAAERLREVEARVAAGEMMPGIAVESVLDMLGGPSMPASRSC